MKRKNLEELKRTGLDPKVMIKGMKILIDVFDKLELEYWLEAGNLLGVIREKEFIKHDNDIDVGVQYDIANTDMPKKIMDELERHGYHATEFRKNRILNADNNGLPHVDIHLYQLPKGIDVISAFFSLIPSSVRKTMIKYAQMTYFQNEKLRPTDAIKRDLVLKRTRLVQLMMPIFFCYKIEKVKIYDKFYVNVPQKAEEYLFLNYGEDWTIPKTDFITYIG